MFLALDTDPNNYDTYLRESISHQLAADLAYAVTNNATLADKYMVRADETRKEYIIALREADNGNIKPLIKFAKN